jgi:hypothetical protein
LAAIADHQGFEGLDAQGLAGVAIERRLRLAAPASQENTAQSKSCQAEPDEGPAVALAELVIRPSATPRRSRNQSRRARQAASRPGQLALEQSFDAAVLGLVAPGRTRASTAATKSSWLAKGETSKTSRWYSIHCRIVARSRRASSRWKAGSAMRSSVP